MNRKPLAVITHSGVISISADGRSVSVQTDHPNYVKIRQAVEGREMDNIMELYDVKQAVIQATEGKIKIDGDVVTYEGYDLHNAMVDRLLQMLSNQLPISSFVAFMENVMLNPRETAVKELWLFLEKSKIPLTEDGQFLAYRRVRFDYTSIHSNPDGTHNRNMIGDDVSMPSNMVDENRQSTCSRGLHACSLSYLPNYGSDSSGDKIMIVKINPKDVVTIPSDYDNAKMRVSRYVVVDEHLQGERTEAFTNSPVYRVDGNGIQPLTSEDLIRSASRVTAMMTDFMQRVGTTDTANFKDSFKNNGLDKAKLQDMMLEIEEEFHLDVNDDDVDHITEHTPMRVLVSFYENLILKKGIETRKTQPVVDVEDDDNDYGDEEDDDLCPDCGEDYADCDCDDEDDEDY